MRAAKKTGQAADGEPGVWVPETLSPHATCEYATGRSHHPATGSGFRLVPGA